jgi:hypothetical protein
MPSAEIKSVPTPPEQLIPQAGVESIRISSEHGQPSLVHFPLGTEPLFEIDGVKALAKVNIPNRENGGLSTDYYIVDVRDHKDGSYERSGKPIGYLVVNGEFFMSPDARWNYNNFASIRKPSVGHSYGPVTVVGGDNNNTRFDRAMVSSISFNVRIMDNGDPVIIVPELKSKNGNRGVEVQYMRDNNDPVNFLRTRREQIELGQEKGEKPRVTLRERLRARVTRILQEGGSVNNEDSGDEHSSIQAAVLSELDDAHGLAAKLTEGEEIGEETIDSIARTLQEIQRYEINEAAETARETLRKNRMRKALGGAAMYASVLALAWADRKAGGILTEGVGSQVNDILSVAEITAIVGATYVGTSFWVGMQKITGVLRGGVDHLLPAPESMETAIGTEGNTVDKIHEIVRVHESFLRKIDGAMRSIKENITTTLDPDSWPILDHVKPK